MITKCLLLIENSLDAAHNLAVESALLARAKAGECLLYLWQNRNTVVIGLNQDAWRECRVIELAADGGTLARRPTGGGAVYHDVGNLNFSFIVPREDYDVPRQLRVITEALRTFGLDAKATGRNDITLNGLKFSGNAFLQQGEFCLHHGTLLVETDLQTMTRYLMPSELKLQSKGIASVRARVTNLHSACEAITVDALRGALSAAFGAVYSLPVEAAAPPPPDDPAFVALMDKYRSRAWVLAQDRTFDRVAHDRFDWGEARVGLKLQNGIITDAVLHTDALDTGLAAALQGLLRGTPYTREVLESLQCTHAQTPLGDVLYLLLLTLDS